MKGEDNEAQKIREELERVCGKRGGQEEISQAMGVHSSSVKRWVEGKEISPQARMLLRWYLFGEAPFPASGGQDLAKSLGFSAKEWKEVTAASEKAGQVPSVWIRGEILARLAFAARAGQGE